jgi:hypothetical protein
MTWAIAARARSGVSSSKRTSRPVAAAMARTCSAWVIEAGPVSW